MTINLIRKLNILALIIICGILLTAFYYQLFIDNVLPCALCNLQRIGFLLFGTGLIINIRTNDSKGGYLLCFISGILGSYVSLLHILIELPPGMPQVGSAIFGIHMYGWAFVIFNLLTIYIVVLRLLCSYDTVKSGLIKNNKITNYLTGLFATLAFACLISVFLETGLRPMGFAQYHYWIICKYQGGTDDKCSRPNLQDLIDEYRHNRELIPDAWPIRKPSAKNP